MGRACLSSDISDVADVSEQLSLQYYSLRCLHLTSTVRWPTIRPSENPMNSMSVLGAEAMCSGSSHCRNVGIRSRDKMCEQDEGDDAVTL